MPYREGCVPALLLGLLGEPVFEHLAREADVASDTQAREPAGAHGLVDPARLDRQFVRDLIGPQQRPGAQHRRFDG